MLSVNNPATVTAEDRNARLDGPIHLWFSLSYSSHLVIDPARYVTTPPAWHAEMAKMLDEFDRAFPDAIINPSGDTAVAIAAEESEYGDLNDQQLAALGVATNVDTVHDSCGCVPEPDEDHEADDASWKRYTDWQNRRWECEHENLRWYDWRGDEHRRWERVEVPVETEEQARSAGRRVMSRSLLQSMPVEWQNRFVQLMEEADKVSEAGPESYDIRFYTAAGARTTDPIPHYNRGRTFVEPRHPN